MTPERELNLVREASERWLAVVDAMTDEEYAAPSLLPGWTRAHVVAHVALNAEGLARAINGVTSGPMTAMYDSAEKRDTDIDELRTAAPVVLRERARAAVDAFDAAESALAVDQRSTLMERVPGGQTWPVGTCVTKRLGEVEIHHADLGLSYTSADWPLEFADAQVTARARRIGAVSLAATDTGHTWDAVDASAVVSGRTTDLAWWLTGRGNGEGLTSSTGVLPQGLTF